MTVVWDEYEQFDWGGAKQQPMAARERILVAELVADLLCLTPEARRRVWGRAAPPGRYAATVIQIVPDLDHRYREQAAAAGIASIGVKVFKTTGDAHREGLRLLPFYRDELRRLPGLPHERVQRSIAAETARDGGGVERLALVQEWVPGEGLDRSLRRWADAPIDGDRARSILRQLLGAIIIPLWDAGTIWWDVRAANLCYEEVRDRLTLIDVDALAAYSGEILGTPAVWARREKGRAVALARLRRLTVRLVLAQGFTAKTHIDTTVRRAWQADLEPPFRALGPAPDRGADAVAALDRFLRRLEDDGILH